MILSAKNIGLTGRLNGISCSLYSGGITAICGPNGAGKSSLLACLAGLLEQGTGEVSLDGRSLASMRSTARAQAIGYLPQVPQVAWDVSVETLVALGRVPWPGSGSAEVESALAAMDLVALRHRPLSKLSGGERARVLLARVLAGEPQWLLADEPLASLDLAHAETIMARFRAEADRGRGVVVVLHDLAAAMNHADRVIVLEDGAIAADGPPEIALAEDVVARVWQIKSRWLGEAGGKALAICN